VGVCVRALLGRPEVALPGRYVMVESEILSLHKFYDLYGKVMGKEVRVVDIGAEAFLGLFLGYVC